MSWFFSHSGHALAMAGLMLWSVLWSLILGFLISASLQVLVPPRTLQKALGHDDVRTVIKAALFGSASSSCSYAATAITRTLIRKGASVTAALVFLAASTNLVIELGLILLSLMGWRFMLGQWIGGIALVAILATLVRLTNPKQIFREARRNAGKGRAASQASRPRGRLPIVQQLKDKNVRAQIGQVFVLDVGMLWKDLIIGMVIAGAVSSWIEPAFWTTLFDPAWAAGANIPWNALIGVAVAIVTFVCSIGNVPMAAVLWASGVDFTGVMAFLFSDLVVLPLIDAYRRAFGLRMAMYMTAMLIIAAVLAAVFITALFSTFGLIPDHTVEKPMFMASFEFNYTFWLNGLAVTVAAYFIYLSRSKGPLAVSHDCCHDH